jgi:hypothetical protein
MNNHYQHFYTISTHEKQKQKQLLNNLDKNNNFFFGKGKINWNTNNIITYSIGNKMFLFDPNEPNELPIQINEPLPNQSKINFKLKLL